MNDQFMQNYRTGKKDWRFALTTVCLMNLMFDGQDQQKLLCHRKSKLTMQSQQQDCHSNRTNVSIIFSTNQTVSLIFP